MKYNKKPENNDHTTARRTADIGSTAFGIRTEAHIEGLVAGQSPFIGYASGARLDARPADRISTLSRWTAK